VRQAVVADGNHLATVFQLADEIPALILAEMPALSAPSVARWAALAAGDLSQNTAMRRHHGPKMPAPSHGRNGQDTLMSWALSGGSLQRCRRSTARSRQLL
jgi:hypothetical protein